MRYIVRKDTIVHQMVVAHLQALEVYIANLPTLGCDTQQRDMCNVALQQLQVARVHWSGVTSGQAVTAALASESCQVVVSVLTLLRGSLGLAPSVAFMPYTSAFSVLASTVATFENTEGMPASGQIVLIHSLQSAVGQRLNGLHGTVMRFDAASGRFCLRLQDQDPPSDWKKVRAENLASEDAARPLDSAREHGRACLEAVAAIFDDLLQEMLIEAPDLEEGSFTQQMEAGLATSMWEALLCCCVGPDDGALMLTGASLLELCGDLSVCSLLTRYVLSAHAGMSTNFLDCLLAGDEERGVLRIRGLQETLAKSYCELFQPSALWSEGSQACDDVPIANLQADLDAHVYRVSEAAVNFGVLPVLIDAADFHLAWVGCARDEEHLSVPLLLPVLLSRLVCSMLKPAKDSPAAAAFARHVLLHAEAFLDVVCSFLGLVLVRFQQLDRDSSATSGSGAPELLLALRAVLDAVVVLAGNGLWSLGPEVTLQIDSISSLILCNARTASEASILARLSLIFLRNGSSTEGRSADVAAACNALDETQMQVLWWQVRARCGLAGLDPIEAFSLAQAWVVDGSANAAAAAAAFAEGGSLSQLGGFGGWEAEVSREWGELEQMIARCMASLPLSLREGTCMMSPNDEFSHESLAAAAEAFAAAAQTAVSVAAASAVATTVPEAQIESSGGNTPKSDADATVPLHFEEELLAQASRSSSKMQAVQASALETSSNSRLSALGMPPLPGQAPVTESTSFEAAPTRQRRKKLARDELERIRGVDPSTAPEDLRCAIDGKVLGIVLRSPYGHCFERATLERWIGMCGSVCPVTGQSLRVEDCEEDHAVEQRVVEWARASKAQHKRAVQDRRTQRKLNAAAVEGDDLS